MHDILFLSHRIPYPPNKGDKIRSFKILEHLCRSYRVHLGCQIDDPQDLEYVDVLKDMCADVCAVENMGVTRTIKAIPALIKGTPISVEMFTSSKLRTWVEKTVAGNNLAAAFVYSSALSQYVTTDTVGDLPLVIDFVDVDSEKWKQYSETSSWPKQWIYRREGKLLLEFDRKAAAQSASVLFVSRAEAELFKSLAPETADKVGALRNGIDFHKFSPDTSWANPYPDSGPHLVFTGSMDYWPNEDAVCWFAEDIFPEMLKSNANVQFYIVGARPTATVSALGRLPNVHVTGSVKDVQPYLAHASAAVAPLRVARGIQNKVLEAMAMGLPTIVTPQALEGIDAEIGADVLVAKDAMEFNLAFKQLDDKQFADQVGRNARKCIVDQYDWSDQLCLLDDILKGLIEQAQPSH